MKMRLESLVHSARQRYGAWAAIFILFAALCTLSVFSARDAREAAADPAKAESQMVKKMIKSYEESMK